MRKVLSILLTAACLLVISACVKDNGLSLKSSGAPESPAVSEHSETSEDPDTPPQVTAGLEEPQQSLDPIIVESSNTVSDKEKEAILDELSDELDSAFGEAEGLEDLEDSDLDVNNID